MVDFNKIQALRPLTTDFKSIFLPLFSASKALRPPKSSAAVVHQIGQLALNIYCPPVKIPQYENLLCQEMARKRADYDTHQPVKSFWFLGHPFKQLSPEAITELCFRFSNHFPHNSDLNTVRGIAVTAADLDKATLALLAGLKFNCVQMHIDALVASKDRSLNKVSAGLGVLADYGQVKLNCKIRFSDQSHPGFLMRLLDLVEDANCQQVELVCVPPHHPTAVSEKAMYREQFVAINKHYGDRNWLICGNNTCYAPEHENNELHKQRRLQLTPWGYYGQSIQTQLGVGVGALSSLGNSYELNTSTTEHYLHSISDEQALSTTQYQLKSDNSGLMKLMQDLLCYHQIKENVGAWTAMLKPIIEHGWLQPVDGTLQLTEQGTIYLTSICKFLFSQTNNEGYNHTNG
ncbi:MAG: hypothetical protein DRR42_04515 [Gammaproteobacteria bacterium]|nr:MAG: hypothetical protein DRR42_04515 [Gammaproteobacteria bacterium]